MQERFDPSDSRIKYFYYRYQGKKHGLDREAVMKKYYFNVNTAGQFVYFESLGTKVCAADLPRRKLRNWRRFNLTSFVFTSPRVSTRSLRTAKILLT